MGFEKDILFRAECSNVFHSLHIVQLWVSWLITIYYKNVFSGEDWVVL